MVLSAYLSIFHLWHPQRLAPTAAKSLIQGSEASVYSFCTLPYCGSQVSVVPTSLLCLSVTSISVLPALLSLLPVAAQGTGGVGEETSRTHSAVQAACLVAYLCPVAGSDLQPD